MTDAPREMSILLPLERRRCGSSPSACRACSDPTYGARRSAGGPDRLRAHELYDPAWLWVAS